MNTSSLFLRSAHTSVAASVAAMLLLTPASAIDLPEFVQELMPSIPSSVIPGQFIVLLKEGDATPAGLLAEYGVPDATAFNVLRGFAGPLTTSQVELLRSDPRVVLVEEDKTVHAFSHTSVQSLPTGIDRSEADLSATAAINGSDQRVNVDIAVLDTGVKGSHKDLNVYRQVNVSHEILTDDYNGHGTHVAGTAAALDNSIGVVGMAPGARIWAIKVLDRFGSGYLSDVIGGIDYVTAHAGEIEVANMSLGCECQSAAMDSALSRSVAAGVVYAVAAGNSAIDAATFSPANHPDVIAVSAIADFNGQPGGGAAATCRSDVDDTFANFSNYGEVVDIAAPGVCINSTWKDGKYKTISGTSMASPHVAGAIGLFLATNPKPVDAVGVAAVKAALQSAATPQSDPAGFTGDPDGFLEPLLNVSGV